MSIDCSFQFAWRQTSQRWNSSSSSPSLVELLKCEGERPTDDWGEMYRIVTWVCVAGEFVRLDVFVRRLAWERERERVGQQLVVVGGKWPENSVNEKSSRDDCETWCRFQLVLQKTSIEEDQRLVDEEGLFSKYVFTLYSFCFLCGGPELIVALLSKFRIHMTRHGWGCGFFFFFCSASLTLLHLRVRWSSWGFIMGRLWRAGGRLSCSWSWRRHWRL